MQPRLFLACVCSFLALQCHTAMAGDPTPVDPGEFEHSGFNLPKGAFDLHPIAKSSWGITERVTANLGLVTGPAASVKVGVVRIDKFALGLAPEARSGWNFHTWQAGLQAGGTVDLPHVRFDFGGEFGVAHTYVKAVNDPDNDIYIAESSLTQPFLLVMGGVQWVASPQTVLRCGGIGNVLPSASAPASLSFGNPTFSLNVVHGAHRFRYSLGVDVAHFVVTDQFLARMPESSRGFVGSLPTWLPFPTIELWWRLGKLHPGHTE